ncbi:MAG: phosphoribosyl-AMP cyclohydrolase, partial [Blautia sp.]|nr:phosphoribosyl-AMP cyclohydrolase [Blautia sp.]
MIKLMPCIYLVKGMAVASPDKREEVLGDAPTLARKAMEEGASGFVVFDLSDTDEDHEEAISCLREICKRVPRPVYAGGRVKRFEDVKKYLYAGCQGAIINLSKENAPELIEEASLRFGKEKVLVSVKEPGPFMENKSLLEEKASVLLMMGEAAPSASSLHTGLDIWTLYDEAGEAISRLSLKRYGIDALVCPGLLSGETSVTNFRTRALEEGIHATCLWSALSWEELKLMPGGLIPVVVQEEGTGEVLMVAYMDQEAYERTLRTGRMTYFSRSRQELWVKGLTSGNFQYVKSLFADCDLDTLLAKVEQVGAACHTGNHSCFYTRLAGEDSKVEKEGSLSVLQEVYDIIL